MDPQASEQSPQFKQTIMIQSDQEALEGAEVTQVVTTSAEGVESVYLEQDGPIVDFSKALPVITINGAPVSFEGGQL